MRLRTARMAEAGRRIRLPEGPSAKPSGWPSISIRPSVASSRKAMQRRSVLLPEPEGPMMQVTSPRATSR